MNISPRDFQLFQTCTNKEIFLPEETFNNLQNLFLQLFSINDDNNFMSLNYGYPSMRWLNWFNELWINLFYCYIVCYVQEPGACEPIITRFVWIYCNQFWNSGYGRIIFWNDLKVSAEKYYFLSCVYYVLSHSFNKL